MTKTSTRNDLIRYIYGETTKEETELIEKEILCDNSCYDEFGELLDVKLSLGRIKEEPSQQVVSKILDYSKSFEMPQFTD